MGKKFETKGKVKLAPQAAIGKDGNQVDYLNEGLRQEADCGCGVDCCNNKFVLKDQSNGNTYELAFDAGVLKFRLHNSADAWVAITA